MYLYSYLLKMQVDIQKSFELHSLFQYLLYHVSTTTIRRQKLFFLIFINRTTLLLLILVEYFIFCF